MLGAARFRMNKIGKVFFVLWVLIISVAVFGPPWPGSEGLLARVTALEIGL